MVLTGQAEHSLVARLEALVLPVLGRYGVELVELMYHPGRHQTIRLLVDKAGGVTIDDCTAVSRRLSADLDAADFVPGRYTLEVSSPGLDRPLRTEADFRRKAGQEVALRYTDPEGKRRTATGTIDAVDESGVTVGGRDYAWDHVVEGKLVI
ncbi:MAG: ribosome maturation factor RimP [Candidatus Zixiibacteriota bacterium]